MVYNDETPDVAYTYDRLGRQLSATSSVSTNIFVHSPVTLELDYELQNGAKIDRSTDDLGRNTGYALYNPVDPVNPVQEITYGFDSYGRFFSVNSGSSVVTNEFDYSYLPGSDILSGYTASTPSTGSTILTASRSYELNRNLIIAITNSVGSLPSVVSSFDYINDQLGRRTARSDYYINRGSTEANTFGYNTFSEVTNANMGTNTYSYAYDPIGNRDQTVKNSVATDYTANGLNQYTNITGGIATMPLHDLDGNLLSFNGWQYVWNGENRIVLASNVEYVVTFVYDHQSRCIEKAQHKGTETRSLSFVWDDFNIISETLSTNNSSFIPHSSSFYIWGLDLSGSLQGAGGVGGLLSVVKNQADLSAKAYYATADANGNVTEYVSTNGTVEAHREYSVFGETLVSTGAMKDDFTHWWSTKPFDPVTGFSEYEYRKYLPPIGRWLSRDPIEERGGLNQYIFINNIPLCAYDLFGLRIELVYETLPISEAPVADMLDGSKAIMLGYVQIKELNINSIPSTCPENRQGTLMTLDAKIHVVYYLASSDTRYKQVVDHENVHVVNASTYLSAVEAALLDGSCLCVPCYNATYALMTSKHYLARVIKEYADAKHDCDSYGNIAACWNLSGKSQNILGAEQSVVSSYLKMKKACQNE
ncbi:MAG: hypothetical protein PHO37_16070 [Kiritimatiellae bacterium]|nr:hypothetical protein [Kiritimatiellia bacterium]